MTLAKSVGFGLGTNAFCAMMLFLGGRSMRRTEAQFCQDQATRLTELASECTDPKVRDDLLAMAREWLKRAKAKDPPPKAA
jgi:hypothetical protein